MCSCVKAGCILKRVSSRSTLSTPEILYDPPLPAGRIEAEMKSVTKRVNDLWTKLPGEINPANLEELRRVKQALVELEPKADTLR